VGDHRVVEVGGDERPLAGEAPEEAPGDDPGAAGDLEHAHTREDRQPCGQIVRVGVEEEGSEVPVVVAGDVADERRVLLGHRGQALTSISFGRFVTNSMEVKA
jgi:hypothetical protein